ncbi:hypothetical protein [Flavobacterium lipolyticum]|uniref:DNRLRE domain-containing protein n=1 Tax=Flavobacterium lipolyticum TaxID=2893754 RepID=A0ABS8M814_9FLAO|nr:hypothetical protein [Flavobacterium sp. F-126]MCC9020462.1 hypothetical protein [Flavobacterium sp. F-126]
MNKIYHTCVVFLLVMLIKPQNGFSQVKYTVLLPEIDKAIPSESSADLRVSANEKGEETSKSFFKFDFKSVPVNAKIGSLALKLYNRPNDRMSEFSVQTITILKGPNGWSGSEISLTDPGLNWADIKKNTEGPIGMDQLKKSSASAMMKLRIPDLPKPVLGFLPDGILSLAARSPEKGQDTRFFSSITAETPSNFSKKPKVLATYEVDPYPFREDWSQSFVNAQHNSLLNWKSNSFVVEAQIRKLPIGNEYFQEIGPTGALAIYKNQPLVFTQATSGTQAVFYVKQLDSRGNVLWLKAVDDVARSWPLIDERGRLYYISRSGKLSILDLNNSGNILFSKSLSEITNRQLSTINNNATIGYDGTLYLPSDPGIVALSAYPQCKIRWKYEPKANEIIGPVSLSPDESKAFFIAVDTQQNKSRLIVLNNLDGSSIATSDYVLGGYKNDTNFYIPFPVVQDNFRVFVLNGYDNSSKLFVFDVDETTGDIKTQFIDSENNANTGISQPVMDAKLNVFFVYNNKLAKYNPVENKAVVFDKSVVQLNNASILVSDASFTIYATDSYSSPQKIMGFKNDVDHPNAFSVGLEASVGNIKKNVTLAPDGTLYTVTATNLIAVTASKVAENEVTVSQSNLSTNTVYRASASIIVEGLTIPPSVTTIFNSAGSIAFKPGFTVTKGAQLTCKTGY